MKEILRLNTGDEFVLFIPPHNRKDDKAWSESSKAILGMMKRIIMSPFVNKSTASDRETGWNKHLRSRERERDGDVGYEFNVRVHAYPSRDYLEKESLPVSSVDHLINPASGAGITLELLG